MGQFQKAHQILEQGLSGCRGRPGVAALQTEYETVQALLTRHTRSRQLLAQHDYAAAKAELGPLLRVTTAPSLLLEAARADLGMGLVDSARRLCLQAVRRRQQQHQQQQQQQSSLVGKVHTLDDDINDNNDESMAYLVQGQCNILSHDGDKNPLLESGLFLLKRALRLDPDNPTVAPLTKQWLQMSHLLDEARTASFQRNFETSLVTYSNCIQRAPLLPPKAPLYSTLHTERAQVHVRLKQYPAALQDVALVLYHRQDHVAAWMVRFAALQGQGNHQQVLEDCQELLQTWGQQEPRIQQAYETADFQVRKAQRPDYYKLLGVSSLASEREIKKAYRTVAKEWHPDRLGPEASAKEHEQAQQAFCQLSEGLEILCNDFQRKLYDQGYDPAAIKERVQAAEQAAHQRSSYHHPHHPGHHRHS